MVKLLKPQTLKKKMHHVNDNTQVSSDLVESKRKSD